MLFQNLMNICDNPDTGFYYVDRIDPQGYTCRIFSYRLIGSYSNFLLPGAMDCRGTMFTKYEDEWVLTCLPMKKFFRLNENPITMNLDINHVDWKIEDKLDGSLISSFLMKNGEWGLKSKTSIDSAHACIAKMLIDMPSFQELKDFIQHHVELNHTVNLELTSDNPDLRIVVAYDQTNLTVLNVRDNITGEILDYNELNVPLKHRVKFYKLTLPEAIDACKTLHGIEGFIAYNKTLDMVVKLKTEWYDNLHYTKTNLASTDNIIRLILTEAIDDFKAIFKDDVGVITRIQTIEDVVVPTYNHIVHNATSFYEQHHTEDRKTYAIGAKSQLTDIEFGIAMSKYLGRTYDIVEHLIKNKVKYFTLPDFSIKVELNE